MSGRAVARDINIALGKLPPQAIDVEESILGAILSDKDGMEKVIKNLRSSHFYKETHAAIYQAMYDLFSSNEPIDMRTVVAKLKSLGKLELVGGASAVIEMAQKAISSAHIESHARIVLEMAIKRELIQTASMIHHEAYEDTTDCFELLDFAGNSIERIRSNKIRSHSKIDLDLAAAVNDHGQKVQEGETCRVDALKDVFAWMRGFVNGWYGWSSDGKSLMLDYLSVIKAKRDNWKFCMFKPENMDVVMEGGKPKIKANRIYKNLAWTLTGNTWNKTFSEKHRCKMMTLDEEADALKFVTDHIHIIFPQDRRFKNMMDEYRFMYEKFGIDVFILDPWYTVKLPDTKRSDQQLTDCFTEIKEFSLLTNTSFNIVNHARSMTDVKDKNGAFKIVNQFMQLGGSAWDIVMDGQFSIYRQNRHLKARDTAATFFNLKQRDGEIVGVDRGEYDKIFLDRTKRQYYFDNINPMDGSLHPSKQGKTMEMSFKDQPPPPTDESPF